MMLIEILEPEFSFKNEAGELHQLVRNGWSQVNVITSTAGSVRGNHHHELNQELFYVISGSFRLLLSKDGEQEAYEMRKGDMFVVLPLVDHTFEYLEDTTLVALYDKGVELANGAKDIIPQKELDR